MEALHTFFSVSVLGALITVGLLAPLGYQYRDRMPSWLRRVYAVFLVAVIATLGRYCVKQAVVTAEQLPEWHISAFWLYGRVAVTGGNYYSPEALRREWRSPHTSQAFVREVLHTGFPYPPPTILLVAPLGYLTLRNAAIVWQAVSAGAALATVFLLWRLFLPNSGPLGLAVTAAMTLGHRATLWNIELTQSGLLVLLCVTLFWTARDRLAGGLFLALGTVVKPVVALLGPYLVLRGKWKAVAIAIGAYLLLALLAIALFGWPAFSSFFSSSPLSRIPGWMYTGHNSQSILAVALRAAGVGPTNWALEAPWRNPMFLSLGGAVLICTLLLIAALVRWAGSLGSELALAISVCAALLLYPNTLNHYTVLLLPPVIFLWTRAAELRMTPLTAIGVVSATYWLVLIKGGDLSVLAIVLTWCTLTVSGARLVRRARVSETVARGLA